MGLALPLTGDALPSFRCVLLLPLPHLCLAGEGDIAADAPPPPPAASAGEPGAVGGGVSCSGVPGSTCGLPQQPKSPRRWRKGSSGSTTEERPAL